MAWFEVTDDSEATVPAARDDVWALLTDPQALVRMTPFLQAIDARGDTWEWRLGVVSALGQEVMPRFTEAMAFTPGERIEFRHAPPDGADERAGVDGLYALRDDADGTHLSITFTVRVRLPLPGVTGPAVRTAMRGVLATMGRGFAANLARELDAR